MLSEADFAFLARETKARTGAALTREMSGLIEPRLIPIARRENCDTVSELLTMARSRADGKLTAAIADALLQTETRFFRDREGFKRLATEILPAMAKRKGEPLRVWCAGVGAGQEAYSFAMIAEELRQEGQILGADIVATDVSERLLDKARAGLYTQFEVQRGLPIKKLIAHFEKAGDLWRVSDRLRASVGFEARNLLHGPAGLGMFDLILCCNVVSGFDAALKLPTIERLGEALELGGALVLGETETLPEGADAFTSVAGIYVKKHAARKAA